MEKLIFFFRIITAICVPLLLHGTTSKLLSSIVRDIGNNFKFSRYMCAIVRIIHPKTSIFYEFELQYDIRVFALCVVLI